MVWRRHRRLAAYAGCGLIVGACYAPDPAPGAPCDLVTNHCPNEQTCTAQPGGYHCVDPEAPVDAARLDAPERATTDAPAVCSSWAARHFAPCDLPSPLGPLILDGLGEYAYDTTTGAWARAVGDVPSPATQWVPSGRVISVDRLVIGAGATLRVIGTRPLIVASWSTIEVAGTIDASSNANEIGAGANPLACSTHAATAGQDGSSGASGGGGGGLGGPGGRGGQGDPGLPGTAGAAVAAPLLFGGCAGGHGGAGDAPGGAGGSGGGAIQLTAREAITISGVVHAGGAGGGAPGNDGGGGGGGSGGMIGLEAARTWIRGSAILAANGGGGGGGSDGRFGAPGRDAVAAGTPAAGGHGTLGAGGDGSAAGVLAGGEGRPDRSHGGGGGGGGGGLVVLATAAPTIESTAIVSPSATAP